MDADTRLAEIRSRRLDEVTAGPWLVADWENGQPVVYAEVIAADGAVRARPLLISVNATEADAQFAASARRAVPDLLARIAELESTLAERDEQIAHLLAAEPTLDDDQPGVPV